MVDPISLFKQPFSACRISSQMLLEKYCQVFKPVKRDDEWSLLLEAAASRIVLKYPGRLIAKTLMIKEAGLNLRLMDELDHFPKCKNVIFRISETCDSYQRRRARLGDST